LVHRALWTLNHETPNDFEYQILLHSERHIHHHFLVCCFCRNRALRTGGRTPLSHMTTSNRAIDKIAFLSLAQKRKFMFLLDSFGGYNSGRVLCVELLIQKK
jgi:hypothetical protein